MDNFKSNSIEINQLEYYLNNNTQSFLKLLRETIAQCAFLISNLKKCTDKIKFEYQTIYCAEEINYKPKNNILSNKRTKNIDCQADDSLKKTFVDTNMHFDYNQNNFINNRLQFLKQQLKTNILRSSYSIRRNLLLMNNLAYQCNLYLLPYNEMKMHFKHLLNEKQIDNINLCINSTNNNISEEVKFHNSIHIDQAIEEEEYLSLPLTLTASSCPTPISYYNDDLEEFKTFIIRNL